jgi:hypothetical protein
MSNLGLLDKNDIIEMANKGDKTQLVLHWEGDEIEPSTITAQGILDEIAERIANNENESELWESAYIYTQDDYKLYESEMAELED